MIEAKYLQIVQDIAQNWGNGTFHIGMRQTLNIPGIKYENIEEVNKYIKNYIHDIEVEMCDVDMDVNEHGYPTIGARNIMSCIGNSHCIKANVNTCLLYTSLTTPFKKFFIVSPFVYGLIHEMLSFVINHFDNFL